MKRNSITVQAIIKQLNKDLGKNYANWDEFRDEHEYLNEKSLMSFLIKYRNNYAVVEVDKDGNMRGIRVPKAIDKGDNEMSYTLSKILLNDVRNNTENKVYQTNVVLSTMREKSTIYNIEGNIIPNNEKFFSIMHNGSIKGQPIYGTIIVYDRKQFPSLVTGNDLENQFTTQKNMEQHVEFMKELKNYFEESKTIPTKISPPQ